MYHFYCQRKEPVEENLCRFLLYASDKFNSLYCFFNVVHSQDIGAFQ